MILSAHLSQQMHPVTIATNLNINFQDQRDHLNAYDHSKTSS